MMTDARKLAHRADPDTAHEAAANATHRSAVKTAILTLLAERGPSTAFELRDRYLVERARRDWPRVQPHSIPRRLSELHRDGQVDDSGQRRRSPDNRAAVVWMPHPPTSPSMPWPGEDDAEPRFF